MTQPTKTNVLTADYPVEAVPYLGVPGKDTIDTRTLDYPAYGLPFVTAPADPAPASYATPEVRPARIAMTTRSATAVPKTKGGGGGGIAVGIGIGLPFAGGGRTPVPVPPPPGNAVGVPAYALDTSLTVEQWWAQYWANPLSPTYVAPGSIITHTNIVDVSPPDLQSVVQAAIDAAPGGVVNTTFRLAPGTYTRCHFYGPWYGIHIIAADPVLRYQICGFEPCANLNASYGYHGTLGWNAQVLIDGSVSQNLFKNNLPRDLLIRDCDFRPDGVELFRLDKFHPQPGINGTENVEYITGAPISAIGWRDVCIENCTVKNYFVTKEDGTPGTSQFHLGCFISTGGVRNVVVRDCTIWGAQGTNAPINYGVYHDGPKGCAVVDCQFDKNWQSGRILFLTNEDFTHDYNHDGVYDDVLDRGNAKYVAVANNTSISGSSTFVSAKIKHVLVAGNTLQQSGNSQNFALFQTYCSDHVTDGQNNHYDLVVRDNTLPNGGFAQPFIVLDSDDGVCKPNSANFGQRGRIGQVTCTNNHLAGTLAGHNHAAEVDTDWVADAAGTVYPHDGPDTISGNSHG